MHLYNASIRGLNQTAGLVTLVGDIDSNFWSASSVSSSTSTAWIVFLLNGIVNIGSKTNPAQVVCVR